MGAVLFSMGFGVDCKFTNLFCNDPYFQLIVVNWILVYKSFITGNRIFEIQPNLNKKVFFK